ncbi:CHAT domain-containing protein [Suillus bovinus]|uniref:CHAT domain-containing protein n=1 Tax=Suillus bovinus TaxID=48563 RepID=UPI001B863B55|nr:CHAT domain-containing protein [Suillus bovinus]KAG2151620.1 CHAT domain-containing protein [Suillus bovinus]
MARRRRVTFESSSSSESDSESNFHSASSRKTSPTPGEKSTSGSEPLEGRKHKCKSSDKDNDNKTKSSIHHQSQKKDDQEPSRPGHTQDPGEIPFSEVQQALITTIRATDLTLGLRRIPAGFHVVVKVDSAEYQTSSKSVQVDQAFIEWHEHILLPCEPSTKVQVSLYASYEMGPMVCHGELLRTLEISVGELLDRSEKSLSIIFESKEEEVVSACTSLFMSVEQRLPDQNDIAGLCPLTTVTSRDMDSLALETDAGHRLLVRYRRTQNSGDLDRSINHFERALDLCPVDHPYRPAALFNLATAKFLSCQANGIYLNIDIPISLFQDALDSRPMGHPDRPTTQLHLAISLLSRFAKHGFQTDADTAKDLLSEVIDVCHFNSHIYRAALVTIKTSALHFVGNIDVNDFEREQRAASVHPLSLDQLVDRAERCLQRDEPHELDEVIFLHVDALVYCNTRHACRAQLLSNLALMLETRFQHRGNEEDLDEAIALDREALTLCPAGHTDRSNSLNNLANELFSRFEHRGNEEDLDEAIALDREALALCPAGHTDRSKSLNNLAVLLSSRFEHRGNEEDLDEAIALHTEALALRPVGHTGRSMSLNNLATGLSSRFEHRGNEEDLDEAIALHTEALALRPVGHTDRSTSLNNLAGELFSRFEHRGNEEDLDEAIALHTEALALRPVGHIDRSMSLNNLAIRLSSRFEHRGNEEDLDQAIALHTEALALCPAGHTDRSMSLNNLANDLSSRFEHRGNDEDLDESIALHREALALCPAGHTDRSNSLNNLANELFSRFEHRGNEEDLDQAIALHTEALALCPVGHTDRSTSLNNLAGELFSRFKHRGNEEDLDQAIALHTEALALCPAGHPDQSTSLNNLAIRLSSRFEHRGNEEDLDQAIALHTEALALCLAGHPDRSMLLNNLANDLSSRFKHRGNEEDLDEAIALHTEALALRPVGHTDRSKSLNNLAIRLSSRFEHRGNEEDLDKAIALHREALALRPVGHTDRSMSFINLANQLTSRFDHQGNREDLNESQENLRCALILLRQHDPRQASVHVSLAYAYLSFYRSALDDIEAGEDTDGLNVATNHLKAAANIVSGGLLFRLRISLDWVHHADEYRHATQLEAYATAMQLMDTYMSTTASVSSRHNVMKDFPSTLAVDAASCALRSGDVCRAVELLEQGRTVIWTQMTRLRMPLDGLQTRGDHAATLLKRFRDLSSLLDKPPASHPDATSRVSVDAEETRYRRLVKEWKSAVEEIRNIEGFSRFLLPPLFSDLQEAAREGPIIVLIGSKSSCYVIIISHKQTPISIQLSTSIEKLQILVDKLHRTDSPALKKALTELWDDVARRSNERSPSVPFVAVGQDHPAGASFTLDSVEPELELVRNLLPPPPTVSFSKITSVDATKSRALCALRDNSWLHLACHGTQNIAEPFKSAFLMRDEPLSLLDITQTDLSRHQFAFLSACDTAVGDRNTPDEVIHLAAGLQFAGVKSVIGTLWKVNDSTVERLVKAFYENFCGDGTMNSKRAARALHRAVYSLGSDQDIPLDQRILFVHIGI